MFDIEKKKTELTEAFNKVSENIKNIDASVSKLNTDRQGEVEKLLQIKGAFDQLEEISNDGTEEKKPAVKKAPAKKK